MLKSFIVCAALVRMYLRSECATFYSCRRLPSSKVSLNPSSYKARTSKRVIDATVNCLGLSALPLIPPPLFSSCGVLRFTSAVLKLLRITQLLGVSPARRRLPEHFLRTGLQMTPQGEISTLSRSLRTQVIL